MHHHDHVSRRYLFSACKNCNLALKPKKCKSSKVTTSSASDDDGDPGGSSDDDSFHYLVPIMFHNLSAYDGHFVLQFFSRGVHLTPGQDEQNGVRGRWRDSGIRLLNFDAYSA